MPETTTPGSGLEIRVGDLAEIFQLFDPSTIQHSHEIMRDSITEPDPKIRQALRNQRLWTADFNMYRVENGQEIHYFAPREHNLIFRDIERATSQLLTTDNYVPSEEGIEEIVKAARTGAVLRTKLFNLRLQDNLDGCFAFFEIDTGNPDSLNAAERAFAERVYGQSDEFTQNMQSLREFGTKKIRVYVLSQHYVGSKARGGGAIARVSCLSLPWFYANECYVGGLGRNYGLRGVLKSAEGAQKVEAMQTTPQMPMPYDEALKIAERYARSNPTLFPALKRMLNEIYRIN